MMKLTTTTLLCKSRMFLVIVAILLGSNYLYAETIVEDFEELTIVDADGNEISGWTPGAGLSNGWKVIGGTLYSSDAGDYQLVHAVEKGAISDWGQSFRLNTPASFALPTAGSYYVRFVTNDRTYLDDFLLIEVPGTAVQYVALPTQHTEQPSYDLQGRPVTNDRTHGVYIYIKVKR